MQTSAKQSSLTSYGKIAYSSTGEASLAPVLFVHGIPTSGYLWRDVIAPLGKHFRCYAPDLMGLGDTQVDPETSDFHMQAQAQMLLDFMERQGHPSFALVCHDQGGAAAQLMVAEHPERIRALVLTNCVAYDNWPVPVIRKLQSFSRWPLLPELLSRSGIGTWLETSTRFSAFRRGVYDAEKLSEESIREYLRPMRESRAGRERFKQFLLAGDPSFTQKAGPGLQSYRGPTCVLWAADDAYLSPSWGKRLYDDIPGARRFELIPFCGHFWQEEKPEAFVPIIDEFLRAHYSSEHQHQHQHQHQEE